MGRSTSNHWTCPGGHVMEPPGSDLHWYVSIIDVDSGATLVEHHPATAFVAASAPKVLLLIAAAHLIHSGALDPNQPVERASVEPVGDSGLWQHLSQATLTLADACTLVASVSDNLATNALLRLVDLEVVTEIMRPLDLTTTRLHDVVRDVRRAHIDPPMLSTATAAELTMIAGELARPSRLSAEVAATVRGWLSTGVDLTLVAAGFGLDPLAHGATPAHSDPVLFNKTGADPGIRVDTGVLAGPNAAIAYTVGATWPSSAWPDPALDVVVDGMRTIGRSIRRSVTGGG